MASSWVENMSWHCLRFQELCFPFSLAAWNNAVFSKNKEKQRRRQPSPARKTMLFSPQNQSEWTCERQRDMKVKSGATGTQTHAFCLHVHMIITGESARWSYSFLLCFWPKVPCWNNETSHWDQWTTTSGFALPVSEPNTAVAADLCLDEPTQMPLSH